MQAQGTREKVQAAYTTWRIENRIIWHSQCLQRRRRQMIQKEWYNKKTYSLCRTMTTGRKKCSYDISYYNYLIQLLFMLYVV